MLSGIISFVKWNISFVRCAGANQETLKPRRNYQEIVKSIVEGLSRAYQEVIKDLSRDCQDISKGFSRACQEMSKVIVQ